MRTDGVAGEFRRVWIRPAVVGIAWLDARVWVGSIATLTVRTAHIPDDARIDLSLWTLGARGQRTKVAALDPVHVRRGRAVAEVALEDDALALPCPDAQPWQLVVDVACPGFELHETSPPLFVDLHRFVPGF